MPGNTVTYVARYPRFAETTLVLDTSRVSRARLQNEVGQSAQRGIMVDFKEAYRKQHGFRIKYWLEFDQLTLVEVKTSESQPSGCGCECPGCDEQGHHCHKTHKGCYQ